MSEQRVFLRDGLKAGKITRRKTDRSLMVQITGPKNLKVLTESPDGTAGDHVVTAAGEEWTLGPQNTP